jgi:hypothetical protein
MYLVNPEAHERVVVVLNQDPLDEHREHPEGLFLILDLEEKRRRQEIHPLAVSNCWVVRGVGRQDVAQRVLPHSLHAREETKSMTSSDPSDAIMAQWMRSCVL